jgi:uncharacterized damage-inducible protein DinB
MEFQTIEPFLKYFASVRERTMRVARCIPPEKIEWTFAAERFTLGDLLRHLALTERYLWGENVQGNPSKYKAHGTEFADGYENVLSFVGRMHAESLEIFGRLTDADLQKKCKTPDGAAITTWKWLRLMIEHEVHHRGQIYIYLSLLGVPAPPLYGLTSEQVRERATAD